MDSRCSLHPTGYLVAARLRPGAWSPTQVRFLSLCPEALPLAASFLGGESCQAASRSARIEADGRFRRHEESLPMLLPRFSLRLTLVVLTGAACFFLVVAQAARGSVWAVGVAVAVGSVLAALATYALFFFACTLFGRLVGIEEIVAKTSRGAVLRDTGQGATPVAEAATGGGGEAS